MTRTQDSHSERLGFVLLLLAFVTPIAVLELSCASWDDEQPASAARQRGVNFIGVGGSIEATAPGVVGVGHDLVSAGNPGASAD